MAGARQVSILLTTLEQELKPLIIQASRAWWDASTSGQDSDFAAKEQAQNALDFALSNKQRFGDLKEVKEALGKGTPLERRQVEVLYLMHLEKQVDGETLKRLNDLSNRVEKAFNTFRPVVGGREVTENAVRDLLRESKDEALRKEAWEASKGVGKVVEKELLELVKLRNKAAKGLGFADYHAMQLSVGEQSQEQVLQIFNELDALTRPLFASLKAEIDEALASSYGIPPEALRPWHYHDLFFQEVPAVFGGDTAGPYSRLDIVGMCSRFYASIGLPIDDVIERSDLYERPGKSPHAFCTDIDRSGDVRVLGNVQPGEYWTNTMLHELGHSVYSSRNMPPGLPFFLRVESHTLTTEGVAMLFEKFGRKAAWLKAMGVEVAGEKEFDAAQTRATRAHLLIFSRWYQVMFRFEKALYGNPDANLNSLWWDLVEEYQGITRPSGRDAPDYASKIHIPVAPCYYHNYMLGELFASQVHDTVAREVQKVVPGEAIYVGDKAIGRFFRDRVFAPGKSLAWDELSEHITGKRLNAAAFAAAIA
ncbi:peptidase m3a and m3b thimet/oligopeptidase F [Klebsormidium nitens]|uniref:Peptidase m3a and m3b thimet/oligopeptidase F n=1 Tax=Klebsormidium nitens TaxID=105231 RepID=A0A1Y1I578_KLENI|nr:peptidase m3a and m3b thimet/oligopeptidase F [Klebsormidium nitens]|eukprot:GAQ83278.1 peptidase m3a and m3b thimet/oligopeptidase F [Klebsormidium nitens]